eukprot:7521850-Pyramimonas_sp.AAC.1
MSGERAFRICPMTGHTPGFEGMVDNQIMRQRAGVSTRLVSGHRLFVHAHPHTHRGYISFVASNEENRLIRMTQQQVRPA